MIGFAIMIVLGSAGLMVVAWFVMMAFGMMASAARVVALAKREMDGALAHEENHTGTQGEASGTKEPSSGDH